MLSSLDEVKNEIANWEYGKVDICIVRMGNNKYDTKVNVYQDRDNGTTYTVWENEEHHVAVGRAKELNEELNYVKMVSIVNINDY